MTTKIDRPVPPLTARTKAFWTSGADGCLRIAHCTCGWWLHPPRPICPKCHGTSIAFEPVSGRGTVHSWTINRYPWAAEMPPPYILAEVELAEQDGLRLLSNIVGCGLDEVYTGQAVTVAFEQAGEAWVPVFRP
jgi:uncharacterized OB-fold protein